MRIYVKTLTGKHMELEVEPTDRAEDVKQKLMSKLGPGIPLNHIRLIYDGKALQDADTLQDSKIQKDAELTLGVKDPKTGASVNSTELLRSSIGEEQLALAHVINAEAEKTQFILGTLDTERELEGNTISFPQVLQIGRGVRGTLSRVILKEIVMGNLLDCSERPPCTCTLHNLVDGDAPGSVRGIHTADDYTMGVDAVAIGTGTTASGDAAVAEGFVTTASGNYSHAEGNETTASGMESHAEGFRTTASGYASHAEGNSTTASSYESHAEGYGTNASGYQSHAEGLTTTASGRASHAEGLTTLASGSVSHAEGIFTTASGVESHAEGRQTTASGSFSHAEGFITTASGNASHAEGSETSARGYASHAEGSRTIASGPESHAEGLRTTASGNFSHAEGNLTTASGRWSHAEGYENTANNFSTHAEGHQTTASGIESHAEGRAAIASGYASHAQNFFTIAQNDAQTAIGRYNVATDRGLNNTPEDDALIIGNGSGNAARSNAFRVQFNGDVHSAGTYFTGGADYAEMFEWQDGNPENEDRTGYFVTFTDEYIRKANASDQFILGVVSSQPSIIADAQSCGWQGMYLKDRWGNIQYEWIDEEQEIPAVNPETNEMIIKTETVRVQRPKLNPLYDANQQYLPRAKRGEWAAVGVIGKLRVRDDGSCLQNGFCRPNADGIATASPQGYRVIKRLDAETILVFLYPSPGV